MTNIPDTVLTMASELHVDVLLEHPITQDTVIRFVCAARKDMIEAQLTDNDSQEAIEMERLLNRIYHQIGYERRNSAFSRGSKNA